jgi:LemA protein
MNRAQFIGLGSSIIVPMESVLIFVLAIGFVFILIAVSMYNGLVSQRNAVANAFASVDAQLQKRYDLVPNLVSSVKGYATHERELFERVAQLRNEALSSPDARTRQSADTQIGALLPQIFALSENYPQLRASRNFLHLQKSLNEIEEQLSAARRTFNACVTQYNNAVESFPSSILAAQFGFQKTDWFQVSDAARNAPSLSGQF